MSKLLCKCELYVYDQSGHEIKFELDNVITIDGYVRSWANKEYSKHPIIALMCKRDYIPLSMNDYWIIIMDERKVIHKIETTLTNKMDTYDFIKLVIL